MKELLDLLAENNLTLGSCESMTGGLFAAKVTSVSGASKVFKGSIVSYSPLVKEGVLGISPNLISKYGVVSKEVAEEMARKAKEILDVDVCVSITGNAGPTCEPGKEGVGVFYIGIAYLDGVVVYRKHIHGDRDTIRNCSVLAMQEEIKRLIQL